MRKYCECKSGFIYNTYRNDTLQISYGKRTLITGIFSFRDMLPNAVLPPSGDHIYAQWMKRPFQPYSSHDFPLRKTCTTPHKKTGSFCKYLKKKLLYDRCNFFFSPY